MPKLILEYTYKGRKYSLPIGLVEKQKLNQEDIDFVISLQSHRFFIESQMSKYNIEKKVELLELLDKWQQNEDRLQLAWGFPLDRTMQVWYNIPHCSCPKMDNADRLGTQYQVFSMDCVYHGTK